MVDDLRWRPKTLGDFKRTPVADFSKLRWWPIPTIFGSNEEWTMRECLQKIESQIQKIVYNFIKEKQFYKN